MELIGQNLSKTYAGKQVVCGVDLTLRSGQVLGVLGPNGAGKSTTVGMLYGMVIPTQGFVKLGDLDVRSQGPQARQYMGIVTQDDNLDPDFNVVDNLIYFARHYKLIGRAAQMRASELMAQVGLIGREKAQINELSGGYKRRLVLARALLNHPKVIFLDEPTTGLDPDVRQEFWKLIGELRQSGCGILLTTHYMDEAERLCDRLILMQQGKVVDRGSPRELIERTVGKEVLEVDGVNFELLRELAAKAGTWTRPFGSGYLIVLPSDDSLSLIDRINREHPARTVHRSANLEDVFLRLTGALL